MTDLWPLTLEEAHAEFGRAGFAATSIAAGRFDALCPCCGAGGMVTVTVDDAGRVRLECANGCSQSAIGDELQFRRERAAVAGANGSQPSPEEPGQPFSLPVAEFIAHELPTPPSLVGTDGDCLLPAVGFGLLIGRGGKGKTTLAVDLALHLTTGRDWLGIPIPQPVRVLLIENEGPREMFRRKLARRVAAWDGEPPGDRLHVYTENWTGARLDQPDLLRRLNEACDRLETELVIGDPLDSFGMHGEGTPSETRQMVDHFKAAGLGTRRAWLLLHHPRKSNDVDAVDQAAGAWGGRPDLMLHLDKLAGSRSRLSFPKARWAGREREPYILGFDPDTGAFSFICEGTEERDLHSEVAAFLKAHPWSTDREISAPKDADEPGIGARRELIRELLEDGPESFERRTGEDARALGRRLNAVVWACREEVAPGPVPLEPVAGPPGAEEVAPPPLPLKGGVGATSVPSNGSSTEPVPLAERDAEIAARYKRPGGEDT